MAFGLLCLSRSKRAGANPERDLRQGMALAPGIGPRPQTAVVAQIRSSIWRRRERARPRDGQVDVLPHRLGLAAIPQLVNFL
jgi:hypothetical protein